ELRAQRVIVPPAAGVFSALGLLLAERELTHSRAFPARLAELDAGRADRTCEEIEVEVADRLGQAREGGAFQRVADMRYAGQAFELTVPLPEGPLHAAALEELGRRFERQHETRYGHSFEGAYALETVNLRVVGRVVSKGERAVRGSRRSTRLSTTM